MRSKLQKFTNFANRLLPHEADYLLSIQKMEDTERLQILQQVHYNCHHINQFTPYDTSINKRKYNHLQNWIMDKLAAVDVDQHFEWMGLMEKKVITDSILPNEEKKLLKAIQNYQHPSFFFAKFYELVRIYRKFLLIRIRYRDHQLTDNFLKKYQSAYHVFKTNEEKLYQATQDIIAQYADNEKESRHWEKWLTKTFYDENLDGLTRYFALVKLSFIAFNYRNFEFLEGMYDYFGQLFSQGKYYSKRILLNYYNNRLILHSRLKDYKKAAYYGQLSVRDKNHDYLTYLNNLCAVLLRLNRNQEALDIMKQAASEAKITQNFHSRIGYISFYITALNKNGLYKNAESYGDTFLKAYYKEILQYRWHLFFSVYFEALSHLENTQKLLHISKKYKLLDRDKKYEKKAGYVPIIPIHIQIARYKEGLLAQKKLYTYLHTFMQNYEAFQVSENAIQNILENIQQLTPEIWRALRKERNLS